MSQSSERSRLKRSISLLHLVGIEIGQSIGAGIFALTGLALARTGPSLPLAFLAAAVPVGLFLAVLAMLGSAQPISGGTYYYGARFFSAVASFTGVWAYLLGAVLGMFPLYALTGAAFLRAVFPALPALPTALALLFLFYLANLLGARIAMWLQAVMVGLLLAALLVFVGAGLPRVQAAHFAPLFPGGAAGFAVASSLLIFTVLGANAAVELGDEILEPRRNIPRSFLISIPVILAIYAGIGLVAAGIAPWRPGEESSLAAAAGRFLKGAPFLFFLLGGGFLAVVTTLNATYLWGTKSLLLVVEDGLLPRGLAAVNRRFGTPHWMLTFIFVISAVSLVVSGSRVETFAIFASLGGIMIFVPVMGAALRLRRRFPEVYARSGVRLVGAWYYLAPAGGLLLCLLAVAILLVDLASRERGWWYFAVFLAWLSGGGLFAWLRRRNKRQPLKSVLFFLAFLTCGLLGLPPAAAQASSDPVPSQKPGSYAVEDAFTCDFRAATSFRLVCFLHDRGSGDKNYYPGYRALLSSSAGKTTLRVCFPAPGRYALLVEASLPDGRKPVFQYEVTAARGLGDAEFLFLAADPLLRADDAPGFKEFVDHLPYAPAEGGQRSFYGPLMLKPGSQHWQTVFASADPEGTTLLLKASALGAAQILDFCLRSCADIDRADRRGMSGLMLAARGGHAAAVRLLLEKDADTAPRSAEGRTALDYARASGSRETVALLEDPSFARPLPDAASLVGEWEGRATGLFGSVLGARLFLDGAALRGEVTLRQYDHLLYNGEPVPPETLRYAVKVLSRSGQVLLRGLRLPAETVRDLPAVRLCGALASPGLIAGSYDESEPYSVFYLEKKGAGQGGPPPELEKGTKLALTCAAFPEYHYTCYIPKRYDRSRPAPLLIFDNAGGKADPLLPALAEELGWISVGLGESSNANTSSGIPLKNEACNFAVLLDARRRLSVDGSKIYFAGFSGGAFRSHSRAILYEDQQAAGVLDIGMGLLFAPSYGIPTFYVMGLKDSRGKPFLEGFPQVQESYGDKVALRTHPGGHIWGVPEALAEGLRWLARR